MAVGEGLSFRDRAVHVAAADALVIADLHLGRAATSGTDLPLDERAGVTGRLERLIEPIDAFRPIVHDPAADETLTFPQLGAMGEFL